MIQIVSVEYCRNQNQMTFIKKKTPKLHSSRLFCLQITNFVSLEKDNAIKYKKIF